MLISLESMLAFRIRGTDGFAGTVHDFHFEGDSGQPRYLVANLGAGHLWRKALIPAEKIQRPDFPNRELRVDLTRDEIAHCPGIAADPPIYKQIQDQAVNYYSWACHWTPWSGQPESEPSFTSEPGSNRQSFRYLLGYGIHTMEGKAGLLTDLFVDEQTWRIRTIATKAEDGKTLLVLVNCIRSICYEGKAVYLDINRAGLIGAPAFDPVAADYATLDDRLNTYYSHVPRPL